MKIRKQSPIFLLQNMCSENLSEIPRKIILTLQAETLKVSEKAFFIYVLIEISPKYREN